MSKPVLTIRFANTHDEEAISKFRIEQYKTAKEFNIVDLNAVTKQSGKIFIAEVNNSIVSTMQIEVVNNKEEFKIIETGFIPKSFNYYKSIYLSKAGTSKVFRNTGLNSLLRKLTIESAIENINVLSLSGTAYSNAPRMHLLKKLGYDIVEIPPAMDYLQPVEKTILFLCLHRDKFPAALKLLNEEIKELESNFSITIKK